MCVASVFVCVSCESKNSQKQYQFGEYVFTQRIPGVDYMYTCAIDSYDEAHALFRAMSDDRWNSMDDISKSKLYQKYGMVIEVQFLIEPYAKYDSGRYMYEDYTKYHIECVIRTREEYEASNNRFQKEQDRAKARVENFL